MKKIGIIGVGSIAQWVHIPGILACPQLHLEALCDTDPQRLELMAQTYHIPPEKCYATGGELIEKSGVDALDICTPNDAHFALALQAARANLPFSVEKPLAMNTAQAEELVRETRLRGLANAVCFSYRFKAAVRFMRDLVRSGELGELYHINLRYFQAWGTPAFHTPLVWRFQQSRAGSGALGDLGSHGLDLVRFVTGRELEQVTSHLGTHIQERQKADGSGAGPVDVDDYANVLARLSGSLPAVFEITRFAVGRGNYQRMEIYGSEGSLVYELDLEPGRDTLSLCQGEAMRRGNSFAQLRIPDEYKSDQMQSFADVLQGKGDGLAATVEDGLQNQRALDAILRSALSGQWEAVQEGR
ncbi:MAG: Gfo/Idh/MocA family protein [Christensenellales bacterium]